MAEKHNTRIDKWLWAVRIYKTRSLASEECSSGRIRINNSISKSSKNIKIGDYIQVRKGIIKYLYRVKKLAEKRMSAKLVSEYLEDVTPKEELIKLESLQSISKHTKLNRKGRPTKKDRRKIDEFNKKINY